MINRISLTDLAYSSALALTAVALVLMGFDNSRQLTRCQAAGRSAAECRLVVLGR
jgi:hypothetical protein